MIRFILIFASLLFAQNARTPTLADFFHHPQSGSPFEFWSYQFTFENGTHAWLTYSLVDLPAIGEKVAAELSYNNFNGKNKSVGKQFDRKEWNESASNATLSIRKSYAMEGLPGANHHVRFSTSKNEDYALDLTFTDATPGIALDAQKLEGTSVYTVVHIPRGRVHGTITIGKESIQVKGTGSLVHTWHNKPATEFAKRSLSLFGSEGKVLCGRILQGKSGENLGGFVVTMENGKAKVLLPQSISVKKNSAKIQWSDPKIPTLALDFSTPYQKYSSLSTVDSWMEKQAAKIAMGGERILYRGNTKSGPNTLEWVATGFEE